MRVERWSILDIRTAAGTYFDMAEIEDLTPIMLRDIRRGQRELAEGLRDLAEIVRRQGTRADARFAELEKTMLQVRDEIELTVKMEVGGRMAGFETRLEARQEEVLTRIEGTFGSVNGEDKPD